MKINLNGTDLEVQSIYYKENENASFFAEEYYRDCQIIFLDGTTGTYDACDVTEYLI
jgi:hypothetical protein